MVFYFSIQVFSIYHIYYLENILGRVIDGLDGEFSAIITDYNNDSLVIFSQSKVCLKKWLLYLWLLAVNFLRKIDKIWK